MLTAPVRRTLLACLAALPITAGSASAQICPGDDVYEDNDTLCTAVPGPMGYTYPLILTTTDDDYFTYTVPPGHRIFSELHHYDDYDQILLKLHDATLGCMPPLQLLDRDQRITNFIWIDWYNPRSTPVDVILEVNLNATDYCHIYRLDTRIETFDPCADDIWDLLEQNDYCSSPTELDVGYYPELYVRKSLTGLPQDGDTDFYELYVPSTSTLNVDLYFEDSKADIDLYLWDPTLVCGGSAGWIARSATVTDDESLSWTNGSGSTVRVIFEVRVEAAGTQTCNFYDLNVGILGSPTSFCKADGSKLLPFCPCGNPSAPGSGEGCLNASGVGAYLTTSGSTSITADDLTMIVEHAMPRSVGIYVQNISLNTGVPHWDGVFCLANDNHLLRHYNDWIIGPTLLPTFTNSLGRGTNAQSMLLADSLVWGSQDAVPGATLYYQFWYRDPVGHAGCGSGANFSSGVSVTWAP